MFDLSDPQTYWLNVTNIGLGLVTLVCCLIVGRSLYLEIAKRLKSRSGDSLDEDDHAFLHADLGVTMADGGEKAEPKKKP